ncbi:MAG: hypothetical protein ACQERZ_09160 [Fusobacteriota bacterium]
MKKISVILFLIISSFIFGEELLLKNGEVLSGEIIGESKNEIKLETDYGLLTIKKTQLIVPEQIIELKNGDVLNGVIKERDEKKIILETEYGTLEISNNKINNIYYSKEMEDYEKVSKKTFYEGEEKLFNVFMNPTGSTMEAGGFYLSGLSYGFGVTENLQLTSNWMEYFDRNLNIRAKLKLVEKLTQKAKHQFSVGGTLNFNHPTQFIKKTTIEDSEEVYTTPPFFEDLTGDAEKGLVIEPFFAYTYEMDKKRGKHALSLGTESLVGIENGFDLYFQKFFTTYWYDISQNIVMLSSFESTYNAQGEFFIEEELVDYLDIGFVYAYKDDLRVGIHFQEPYFSFYYRIY